MLSLLLDNFSYSLISITNSRANNSTCHSSYLFLQPLFVLPSCFLQCSVERAVEVTSQPSIKSYSVPSEASVPAPKRDKHAGHVRTSKGAKASQRRNFPTTGGVVNNDPLMPHASQALSDAGGGKVFDFDTTAKLVGVSRLVGVRGVPCTL